MRVKPKEILVNLPIVLTFTDCHEIPEFAANINTLIYGKVKVKYEELGELGGQYIGLFYINRNDEFSELRAEFKEMIEAEEMVLHISKNGSRPCPESPQYSGWCNVCKTKHNEG